MHIMRSAVASGWIILLFAVIVINGCGEADTPAQVVRTDNNFKIREIYFDKPPENLNVTGAAEYTLLGTKLQITFAECGTDTVVSWQGGQETFYYDCGDPPSATTVLKIQPPPGVIIPPNQLFTLRLDQGVDAVTVNGTAAEGAGRDWIVEPGLAEGENVQLLIEWTNRDATLGVQQVGPYTVRAE